MTSHSTRLTLPHPSPFLSRPSVCLRRWSPDLKAAYARIAGLEAQMSTMARRHQEEMEGERHRHDTHMKDVKRAYDGKLSAMKERHQGEVKALEKVIREHENNVSLPSWDQTGMCSRVTLLQQSDVTMPAPPPASPPALYQVRYDSLRRECEKKVSEAQQEARQTIRDARQKYHRECEEKMKKAREGHLREREALAIEIDEMTKALQAMESKVYTFIFSFSPCVLAVSAIK